MLGHDPSDSGCIISLIVPRSRLERPAAAAGRGALQPELGPRHLSPSFTFQLFISLFSNVFCLFMAFHRRVLPPPSPFPLTFHRPFTAVCSNAAAAAAPSRRLVACLPFAFPSQHLSRFPTAFSLSFHLLSPSNVFSNPCSAPLQRLLDVVATPNSVKERNACSNKCRRRRTQVLLKRGQAGPQATDGLRAAAELWAAGAKVG